MQISLQKTLIRSLYMGGHTYERIVLERWLEEKKTSPMTNLPLKTTAVVPNIALRKSIEKWEEIAHDFAIDANS